MSLNLQNEDFLSMMESSDKITVEASSFSSMNSNINPDEIDLATGCFGTIGTLGTACGCAGTFGTFGCMG
ncbi:thiocillin family RiPP [Flavobacterium sp. NKUCC04_CG]|uniref:thiocillin family RiPP n=1 Tax=Flavobacterium sp. NKUCC04_CG TaxID=2842121 RepID=UPI001C5AD25D|nr:thiocillin family RiPP [Flavobacterium sp. NKUCC04_CG]MBW3518081.1 thiocillin family RiPP [Flavobacterium sp. NKUCC04_CG]